MATDHVARQVFDLPEPQPLIVTEHRAQGCRCAACGMNMRAVFPAGITAPVQYGARIAAFVGKPPDGLTAPGDLGGYLLR